MDNFILFLSLFLGGTIGHLLMRVSGDVPVHFARFYRRVMLCNSGESITDTKIDGQGVGDLKFTDEQQKFIDKVIDRRVNEVKSKFTDYDDLRKFKSEHDKVRELQTQKELEEQKKYDEAKKTYETQINQHKDLLSKKDLEINNLRIEHKLINEIAANNGYAEESLALLKSSAILDSNGNVVIKGKDANGFDTQLPVGEGVKRFLESRPYLVKSTHKAGAGTASAAGNAGTGDGKTTDHSSLNKELFEAQSRGDFKRAAEIRSQLKQILASKGVSI